MTDKDPLDKWYVWKTDSGYSPPKTFEAAGPFPNEAACDAVLQTLLPGATSTVNFYCATHPSGQA
jgi:hypothetical protein